MNIKHLAFYLRFLLWTLLISCFSSNIYATHNRAGEITYEHISGNTYRAKIVTYTKILPPAPDRPELEIFWGDGGNDTIARSSVTPVAADIKRNEYYGIHTYSGPGTYIMYFIDENRNADVKNIPSSVYQPFYVETKLVINSLLNQLNIYNNSPVLLEPPIDDGVVNQIFIHNPSAYDPDGDSLSYEITACKGDGGAPIIGYYLPISPGSNITINSFTGDFIWNVPLEAHIFNFAILIKEWKNIPGYGIINVGYVTRDFQVNITTVNNQSPQLTVSDTCVEAGSVLAFNVNANDPNADSVTITASGGPFQVAVSPALPDITNVSGLGSATYNFSWNTNCAHIRKTPYQIVFKAIDNHPFVPLSDVKSMNIYVIGPSPKNPAAAPLGSDITLQWNPNTCSNAKGYYIYRKINIANYTPGYCITGVPASTGYVRIGKTTGINDTTYIDNNNGQGLAIAVDYCYMITAYFADGAEGYPSVEVCAHLNRDLPVITNADVLTTSSSGGTIYIAWSPPVELDTLQYTGPYQYVLQRAIAGFGTFTDVATFNNWNDTTYTDNGLNTAGVQYIYRVQFKYDGGTYLGKSQDASSIFLSVTPGDEKVRLNWSLNVPWTNSVYYIYRSEQSGPFVLIDSSALTSYTDYTAINDTGYCYYVESKGKYTQSGLVDPILNKSQSACAVPFDNEAPCIPVISALVDCDSSEVDFSWNFTILNDCKTNDIDYFTVYYAAAEGEPYDSVGFFRTTMTAYSFPRGLTIGGCYYLTVTDTNGNVTGASNEVCVESCPVYELPNVFTPDGNNINDLFTPIEQTLTGLFFRDIKEVDMKIFNRWGDLLFETKDPVIGWNGKRHNDGEDAPEGTYFYTCIVYIAHTKADQEPLKLHGAITLFRGSVSE